MTDTPPTEEPNPKREPMTSRQVISRAVIRARSHVPIVGMLALFAGIEPSVYVRSVATDGRAVLCSERYLTSAPLPDSSVVLLHGVLHAALLHVPRQGDRDPLLWNVAADIVVNGILAPLLAMRDIRGHAEYVLPEGSPCDPALSSLTVEEVYDRLRERGGAPDLPLVLRDLHTPKSPPGEETTAFWRDAWRRARARTGDAWPWLRFGKPGAELAPFLELSEQPTELPAPAFPDPRAVLKRSADEDRIALPEDPFALDSLLAALAERADTAEEGGRAFAWLVGATTPEWVQIFAADLFVRLRPLGQVAVLAQSVQQSKPLQTFLRDYTALLAYE